ncbi:hypothetical protein PsorP6_017474 [Peronosclerospora sorghi]|uniref:Uncharacterized protein n=1 Tax=Peronosclerospora sorghi TaxID=230839 RepID=A0ACC0WLH7_9STRA|nr:hypothetical protein PsorP6_017474 [Peronosclerospora sorghi]
MELLPADVDGVPALSNGVDGVCGGCASGKMSASPFEHTSGSVLKTLSPFGVVHSDVMVPIKPPPRGGAKYMVSFIDNYTRLNTDGLSSIYLQTTAKGYVRVDDSKRSKLYPKAYSCIFLGYAVGSKAYRVWELDEERLVTTRTVHLNERPPSPYLNLTDDSHPATIINLDVDDKSTSMPDHAPQPFQSDIEMGVDFSGIVDEDVVMDDAS